jgi:hypothetical protein
MPPLNLYARVRFFVQFCTRDRGCSVHPAFPAPSSFGAKLISHDPGASRRGNAEVRLVVIASEAKQSISPSKGRMDCFVASLLAMTWTGQCYPVPPTGRPNGRLTTGFGRTIQYSRDIHVRTEKPQRTGCPAFAGMTSNR